MKPKLSIETLKIEAKLFCEEQSKINHKSLIGVTDGKAVGTYIEHLFQEELSKKYSEIEQTLEDRYAEWMKLYE